ncbi:MAG: class I SAM-dependent DNA methyltransferase [Phycisphaerae bacterium]
MSTNHFDQAAATWDENPHRRELTAAIARAIATTVPLEDSASMLDFGCGTGTLSVLLSPLLGRIDAVDPSEGMIQQLRNKLQTDAGLDGQIRPMQLVGGVEQLQAGWWDLICSAMVMHHIDNAEATLLTLAGRLSPGGWLAVADLVAEDGSFHADQVVPHHGFDPELLVGLLAEAGMKNVSARIVHEIVKPGGEGLPRAYPVFLITGQKSQ